MTRRIALILALFLGVVMCAAPASAQITYQGATAVSTGQLSVLSASAYAARYHVYLMVYETPSGIQGRFVNASGATVGNAFLIAGIGDVNYANKPMVAYSTDTADDVFFVMFATDRGKAYGGPPSAYIQRVSFTGTGGALVGGPFLASQGGYETPNDIVYNPVTRQFVAVFEHLYSEGPDVIARFFAADGTPASVFINVSLADWSQGAAKAAVDWQTNRILIAYQGLAPVQPAPPAPEVLGMWAKIIDGSSGALLTDLLTVQSGGGIEVVPVFVPEHNGFVVAWTAFNPGRDVMGHFVSSATGSIGSMPSPVYTIAGSSRQEGAAMGMYDAISRRVLMAMMSNGGCAGDTCPYLDGALLDGQGVRLSSFTGLSTATVVSGTFFPDVAVGEGGQFGVSYVVDYVADYVERVSLPAAPTPGPRFGVGAGVVLSPTSLTFSIAKTGANINGFTPQNVSVTFQNGPYDWSAVSSVPWLQVTSGAGSGNGQFSVTVINPANVIGSQRALGGSIVLFAPGQPNSPVILPVALTVMSLITHQVHLGGGGSGDALAYQASTGNWTRLTAQQGGGFSQAIGGWAANWSISPARFNADGLSDFFLFNTATGDWYKLLNNGSGFTVQANSAWWPGWQRFVMDLDGDGISDLFLYDPVTGMWFECISTPTGFVYTPGGWSPGWDVRPMYLDGDNLEDLFLINRTTGQWFWALGLAGGGFTYPATGFWYPSWVIHPGDFNGDGLTDLLLHDPATGMYFVAMTAGSGFAYTQGFSPVGSTPSITDLDNDGADDIFLYDRTTGVWSENISNHQGQFTTVGASVWSPGWDVYPTDFDGDGRADILLYNPITGAWYQARNVAPGSFAYTGGYWATGLTIIVRGPDQ